MKKYFFTAILVLFDGLCFAQETDSRFSAAFSAGASFPVGNFASKANNGFYVDNMSHPAGWAKPGPAFQLSLNYCLQKTFGLSLLLAGQGNKQDESAFESSLKELFNTDDNFAVKTNSWKIFRIMVGGFYDLSVVQNKFIFQPTILIGILKTSIPARSYYDSTNSSWSYSSPESSLPIAFCYEIGMNFRWHFSKSLYLKAVYDFFHASPKGYDVSVNTTNFHYNTAIPISSVNALAGIGVRF